MKHNDDTPPSRLTPAQIAQVTDGIVASQQAPPALTPAKVEALMARFFSMPSGQPNKDAVDMATFVRPADAVDAGLPDLGPLASTIIQCTKAGGQEGFGITVMYAAYGLWAYWQAHADKQDGGEA